MKPFGWILILLIAVSPAWSISTKKITVQELKDLLTAAQAAKKSDDEVALQLKQVELSEELTTSTMNSLSGLVPGPLSTEQMYVLEARSALLAPPASDLPTAAAPDTAAQQAMLAKTSDYASKSYAQLPPLTATKMTARFQDGVEAVHNSGMKQTMSGSDDPVWEQTSLYTRLMNTHSDTVETVNGVEKASKDKTQWGMNNMVASVGPALSLDTILQEATGSGTLKWLRWESINGIQIAVYSFTVDKKKTHYAINYCCFPETMTAGVMHFSSSGSAASGGSGTVAKGNLQTANDWKNFKTTAGYHGELFLDPASGTIVRTVTQADFKPSDFVHYEYIRTDYAPVPAGGKSLFVPVRTFTIAEIVPNGDSFAAHYAVRHNLVTQDYKDYQLVHANAASSAPEDDAKPLIKNGANKLVQEVNADVIAARAANREKRYADAEAIVLKDTASNPGLIPPWIELGLAQLGLKQYTEAEASFKTALAINPQAPKSQQDTGFQGQDNPNSTHVSRRVTAGSAIASEQTRPPDVIGILDSSLGEVYIRTNRAPEAEAAFDAAAQANPAQAAFYLRNETIFFFQTGNADAQLKAAEKAIAADPTVAVPYYFKGMALVTKATVDPTGKTVLPPGCTDAYQKYLQLDPNGAYSADAKAILASAGVQVAKK
jgi:tetratricopeptide (TPR) repeat protein